MFCEAQTGAGRLIGLDHGPVRAFKGVPYGSSTTGANRFKPPRPMPAWTDARPCFGYGPASPQAPVDPRYTFANLLQFNLSSSLGGMGEDCLNLNLWTPGLRDGTKRPVLVSLHGGGFNNGSGNLPLYDGAQLAVRGDVVVVSVTHRLNVLGYLDLSEFDPSEEFASAGVAGLLDLVAALEWVRDNIEEFGGDPANVTVFGQSGGAWKVSCLLAMPAARGLFARAVIQSGSLLQVKTKQEGAALASGLLTELGVAKGDLDRLQSLPWTAVLTAGAKAGLHLFEPVLGSDLPLQPAEAISAAETADVPVMIGTTLHDGAFLYPDPALGEGDMRALLEQRYGERADSLIDLYRRHRPGKSPYLLLGEIVTDAGFRRFAHAQAEGFADGLRSPVFVYQWNWTTPAFNGVFGAAHATDIPATFHNLHDPLLGAGDLEGTRLAEHLSQALVNFARTGRPEESAAAWPKFEPQRRTTMIFDRQSGAVNHPDAELRAFWADMPMATTVFG